tara:strand:+ start:521 stop:817 length:297 start_codon:yes stop_codon:yes gene_type:complete
MSTQDLPTTILDPTDEREPIKRTRTKRPEHITGTVGLLDISKPRGNKFLDQVEMLISNQMPNVKIQRYMKPTFAKPAPYELRRQILNECNFVIEAVAD